MTQLRPAQDASPADWIVADLQTFGESVLSLLPAGFAAYVRLFHPARRLADGEEIPVRWAEIAAATGTRANPAMQLNALAGGRLFPHEPLPGVYAYGPSEGSLPAELAGPLAEVLARHTMTAERCWFAVWDGFGATRNDIHSAPTFHLPNRDYHLLVGPVRAVTESTLEPQVAYQSPNLWWPDDRAWCVATEIDLDTTYVACSEACRDVLLAAREFEALAIDPATGIDMYSDPVNTSPTA